MFVKMYMYVYAHGPVGLMLIKLSLIILSLMCEYKSRKLNSVPVVKDGAKRGEWVKCVTRTRVGKPALGFYESLKYIYSSKTNAVKHRNN